MNINHTFQKAFVISLTFFTLSSASFAVTLDCNPSLGPGIYLGHFTDLIDKDGWDVTNYRFQRVDDDTIGCVQLKNNTNSIRRDIIQNAFLLNKKVYIKVGNHHVIEAIGLSNSE